MNQNDQPTEHILACLSSSPSNAKIVRTAVIVLGQTNNIKCLIMNYFGS